MSSALPAQAASSEGGDVGVAPNSVVDELRGAIENLSAGDGDAFYRLASAIDGELEIEHVLEVLYRMSIESGCLLGPTRNLANLLSNRGHEAEARVWYRQALEAGDPLASFLMAQSYEADGDLDSARGWYQKDPLNPLVPVRLARVLRAQGNAKRARQVLKEGAAFSPEAAVEWVAQGRISNAEAIELLERHLREGAVDVLIPLADLYEKAGRRADAEGALRWSLESGEPNAAHNLALFLWENGREQEGVELWVQAANAGDAMAVRALGRRDIARFIRREARCDRRLASDGRRARVIGLMFVGGIAGVALGSRSRANGVKRRRGSVSAWHWLKHLDSARGQRW
jgi:Flp pilus assembly protein TadD